MITKLMGRTDVGVKQVHTPSVTNFVNLHTYSKKDVQHMMTSDEWTKAVFVRDPKERVLSAFLEKFVGFRGWYVYTCCSKSRVGEDGHKECTEAQDKADFTYFLRRSKDCWDTHWDRQVRRIDDKWWPYINFIGDMGNLEQESKKLLKRLVSQTDGLTAWEKFGKTGWGKDGKQHFLHVDEDPKATGAHNKLKKFYNNPCDEKFVEMHWKDDWQNPYFGSYFAEYKLNGSNATDLNFRKDCADLYEE